MGVANVTAGKPSNGGAAIYRAPLNTALPTDASTALDTEKFKALGFISDAGVTNSNSASSTDIKAWGGQTVLSIQTDKPDTFQFSMLETLDADVIKAVYNSTNVTTAEDGTIELTVNSAEPEEAVFVIDMIMRNGALKRIVIPDGKITTLADIVYSDSAAVGYDVTISALPDAAGNNHYEYIKAV